MHMEPNQGAESSPRAANLLGALVLAASDRLRAALTETGGSMTRSSALVLLSHVPGSSIDWLARRLYLSHSATVRLVDGLIDGGLIKKQRGIDARMASLSLTRKGAGLVRRIRTARLQSLEDLVGRLDVDSRQSLVTVAEELLYSLVERPGIEWEICRLCNTSVCINPTCPVLDAVEETSAS